MTPALKEAVLQLILIIEKVHYATDPSSVGFQYFMETQSKGLIQHKGFGLDVNWEINSVPR